MAIARTPIDVRFWRKVQQADGCWQWTGALDPQTGYGRIGKGGRKDGLEAAHRVSWAIHFGTIPKDREVCHHCDNRWCVNPAHLFLGTRSDNMRDAHRKGRTVIPSRWYVTVWNFYKGQRNVKKLL